MIHELKTHAPHFEDVITERKKAELRLMDRPFAAGDLLWLREYDPDVQRYTERECLARVTHILTGGPWLADGYGMLSIDYLGYRAFNSTAMAVLAHYIARRDKRATE